MRKDSPRFRRLRRRAPVRIAAQLARLDIASPRAAYVLRSTVVPS
jgi:hypothetical protein